MTRIRQVNDRVTDPVATVPVPIRTMAAATLAAVATLSQKLGGEHEQTVLNIVVKSL